MVRGVRRTGWAIGAAGAIAVAGGFLIGNSIFAGSTPDSTTDSPAPLTTTDSSTPIPIPAAVEELPALDLPPETTSAEPSEVEPGEDESSSPSFPEPQEEVEKESSQSRNPPEITVAPTE
jgi:hypothetical protein